MKKLLILALSIVLVLFFTSQTFASEAEIALQDQDIDANLVIGPPIYEIESTCPNHSFTRYGGYSAANKQHTYYCSNSYNGEKCTSFIVEECYNYTICASAVGTYPCARCGNGSFVVAHNYQWTPDGAGMHIKTCKNNYCSSTTGGYVKCSGQRNVYKGYDSKGHYVMEKCTTCNDNRTVGNAAHTSSNLANCTYCKIPSSPGYIAY